MENRQKHRFIFSQGIWIGEGKITLSTSPEILHFYTKWTCEKGEGPDEFSCRQQVEIQGIDETVINELTITLIHPHSFRISLKNELMRCEGQGTWDGQAIAWEFPSTVDFAGFELYELQSNGDYIFHAEYSSSEAYRTLITGKIWEK